MTISGLSIRIVTERLVLRRWTDADRAPFAAINSDPAVMAHFPSLLTPAESDALIDRIEAGFETRGYGLWAVERRSDGAMVGFTGFAQVGFASPIENEIEIGWRLRRDAWGTGLAREAAATSLEWGWANLAAPRIVSMTVAANRRSWGLMERLGLQRRVDLDFDHPRIAEGHALRRHIVYAIERR